MRAARSVTLLLALSAAVPATAPAQTLRPAATNAPAFNFNFDQLDIRVLVKLAGEMTGRKFIVDDKVAGKVTVVSPERIAREEVLPLLQSALEASGFSLADRGDAVHIIPLPKGEAGGAQVVGPDAQTPASGYITKVVKVGHVSAVELKKLLEPLIRGGKEGAVSAFAGSNHLIITDTADNVRQAEKIVAELDRAGSAQTIQVIPLQHASPDDIAPEITLALKGAQSAGSAVARHLQQVGEGLSSLPSGPMIIPSPHAMSLVVVGTPLQIEDVKRTIGLLDVEPKAGAGRLHVIFLKYLLAEDAAKSLNALLAKTVDKDKRSTIALESSSANNALIVEASQGDFMVVKELVTQLDTMPQQVLVEIMIAEIQAGKSLDFGATLSTVEIPDSGQTAVIGRSRPANSDTIMDAITQGIFPQGISFGIAHGSSTDASGNKIPNVAAAITALAQNRDVKILSNVPLWAQNNAEATVNVVENIPVLKSTIQGGSGTARDVIQNIDRMDVGIKLKLTPHVNPDSEITLKLNPSIEAIVDEGTAGQFSPTIARRDVTTTVTVSNNQSVIISGLIREDRVNQINKVPLLGDIPLLGWLFKSKSDAVKRTNLLILVTPHLVSDARAAAAMKAEWQQRAAIDPTMPVPAGGKAEK